MSKKVFALVSGIVGALQTAGVAIVTYTAPESATATILHHRTCGIGHLYHTGDQVEG